MTKENPVDMIAPRQASEPGEPIDILSTLLAGAYDHGVWLGYHSLRLYMVGVPDRLNVWEVQFPNRVTPVDVLNCNAFRSAVELQYYLDDLRAVDPTGYDEWRQRREHR
jgi:hypothetical protein